MKAVVLHGPGDVRFESVADLKPARGEIVVRTLAALTCGTDLKVVRRGYHAKMLTPPCVFGHEAAGEVAAVGEGVTSFKIGERVVAANSAPCGRCPQCARGRDSLCQDLLFWNGTFADAYLVPARVVERNVLPLGGVTPLNAAMTEPLACCVKGVQDAFVRERDRVLVVGAGPVGLMLIHLCALTGARVTVAARRAEALLVAATHGAHETVVITPGEADPWPKGGLEQAFDVVFDTGGVAETAALAIRAVARGGAVNLFAGCPAGTKVDLDVARVHYDELRILGSFHHTPATFREAFRLIESGVIDPLKFITDRKALRDLPESLMEPMPGALKTMVLFP